MKTCNELKHLIDRSLKAYCAGHRKMYKVPLQLLNNGKRSFDVMDVILDTTSPKAVLEWGPGRSTIMIAEALPQAAIGAVEHHPQWHARCQRISTAFPHAQIKLRRLTLKPGSSEHFVTEPLYSAKN
jgi:predicted O-methyltransferase YrrM